MRENAQFTELFYQSLENKIKENEQKDCINFIYYALMRNDQGFTPIDYLLENK